MDNSFLFVTCVQDEEMYNSCLKHLGRIKVPENGKVDFLAIRGAKSMAEGYNQALQHKAKYKVYLHEDTIIINKDLLENSLTLFQSHPEIGMLGVMGCKKLPPEGLWWEGKDLYGKILANRMSIYDLVTYQEVKNEAETVDAIDGVLMITQYDLPWREDIISGFHFYDISQSMEFKMRGYSVAIPKQVEPWAFHARTTVFKKNEYEIHRNNFLHHYGHLL